MAARPKSCAAMFKVDPTLGAEGCKRLPRHKGDHRATLHVIHTAKPKASKASGLTKAQRAELDRLVAEGLLTPEQVAVVTAFALKAKPSKVRVIKPSKKALAKVEASRVQRPKAAKRRGNVFVTSGAPSARLA